MMSVIFGAWALVNFFAERHMGFRSEMSINARARHAWEQTQSTKENPVPWAELSDEDRSDYIEFTRYASIKLLTDMDNAVTAPLTDESLGRVAAAVEWPGMPWETLHADAKKRYVEQAKAVATVVRDSLTIHARMRDSRLADAVEGAKRMSKELARLNEQVRELSEMRKYLTRSVSVEEAKSERWRQRAALAMDLVEAVAKADPTRIIATLMVGPHESRHDAVSAAKDMMFEMAREHANEPLK